MHVGKVSWYKKSGVCCTLCVTKWLIKAWMRILYTHPWSGSVKLTLEYVNFN